MEPGNLARGNEGQKQAYRGWSEENSERSTKAEKQQRFDEQLTQECALACAKNGAQGDFFPARLEVHDTEIAHVQAKQEQSEADGSGEGEQRGAEIAGHSFAHGDHQRAVVFVFGKLGRKALRDNIQGGLRHSGCYTGAEVGGNSVAAACTLGGSQGACRNDGPNVDLILRRKRKPAWCDADDDVRCAIQANGFAGKCRIGGVSSSPEVIAQDYAALTAVRVVRGEETASRGCNGKRREDVGGNDRGANALRIADTGAGGRVTPWQPED